MTDDANDAVVDGFSDSSEAEVDVDAADRGLSQDALKPYSPEEYARLQKEAREENPEKE